MYSYTANGSFVYENNNSIEYFSDDEIFSDESDNSVQPHDYSTFNNDAANKQYYQQYYNQYVPYYTQAGNQSSITNDKSQLLDKLNSGTVEAPKTTPSSVPSNLKLLLVCKSLTV